MMKEGTVGEIEVKEEPEKVSLFYLRKLTKSGASRYLSIGKILPSEWDAVKVFVVEITGEVCVLRLELIK